MTQYLISIGHRTIGFVMGPEVNLSTQQKYEGFCKIMQRHKLPLREELVAEGENTLDSGVLAGKYLLKCNNRPTAIFASNDAMALGVMKSAAMLGISVPEQISVAGYDDGAFATVTWPELTTIRQPVEQMGELAAGKLLAQLANGNAPPDTPVVIEPKLVVRNSTRQHTE